MLSRPYRMVTITCLLLAGLNFYGYQFFSGFVTTYLKEVRQFDGATIGLIFSISAFGSLFGAWVWGAIADKLGRKVNALGFILAGVMVSIFFIAPSDVMIGGLHMLALLGLIYNFGLSASAVWGIFFRTVSSSFTQLWCSAIPWRTYYRHVRADGAYLHSATH